jgi:hypothetical protein
MTSKGGGARMEVKPPARDGSFVVVPRDGRA